MVIEQPDIPESLSEMTYFEILELGWKMRAYFIEVLISRPDLNPNHLHDLPCHNEIMAWVDNARDLHDAAFEKGEYDGVERLVFWLLKIRQELEKKGFTFCETPRKKRAMNNIIEGYRPLRTYMTQLFDILWELPFHGKYSNTPDEILLREQILPGSQRFYLEYRKRIDRLSP